MVIEKIDHLIDVLYKHKSKLEEKVLENLHIIIFSFFIVIWVIFLFSYLLKFQLGTIPSIIPIPLIVTFYLLFGINFRNNGSKLILSLGLITGVVIGFIGKGNYLPLNFSIYMISFSGLFIFEIFQINDEIIKIADKYLIHRWTAVLHLLLFSVYGFFVYGAASFLTVKLHELFGLSQPLPKYVLYFG